MIVHRKQQIARSTQPSTQVANIVLACQSLVGGQHFNLCLSNVSWALVASAPFLLTWFKGLFLWNYQWPEGDIQVIPGVTHLSLLNIIGWDFLTLMSLHLAPQGSS